MCFALGVEVNARRGGEQGGAAVDAGAGTTPEMPRGALQGRRGRGAYRFPAVPEHKTEETVYALGQHLHAMGGPTGGGGHNQRRLASPGPWPRQATVRSPTESMMAQPASTPEAHRGGGGDGAIR